MNKKFYYQILFMLTLLDENNQFIIELNPDNNKPKRNLGKHDFELSNIKTLLKLFLVQNQTSIFWKTTKGPVSYHFGNG